VETIEKNNNRPLRGRERERERGSKVCVGDLSFLPREMRISIKEEKKRDYRRKEEELVPAGINSTLLCFSSTLKK
jgi:hypothetical protein